MGIVALTESAAAKIRELLARDGHRRSALRLVLPGAAAVGFATG
jgi:Fe-S cluster assembly iron-binding protein IscA